MKWVCYVSLGCFASSLRSLDVCAASWRTTVIRSFLSDELRVPTRFFIIGKERGHGGSHIAQAFSFNAPYNLAVCPSSYWLCSDAGGSASVFFVIGSGGQGRGGEGRGHTYVTSVFWLVCLCPEMCASSSWTGRRLSASGLTSVIIKCNSKS